MASLLASSQTLAQIHTIAHASSAKIGRVTLSRSSSRNLLPTGLECSRKSAGGVPTLASLKQIRPVDKAKNDEWTIDIAKKPASKNPTPAEEGGIIFNFAFFFMTALEVVFFGPYDIVTTT